MQPTSKTPAPRKNLRWRNATLKTINFSLVEKCVADCESANGKWAFAEHPAEGDTPRHWHAVFSYGSSHNFDSLANAIMKEDPHSYFDNARSFVRCCRYLRHLDSPQKCAIPPSSCKFGGSWCDGEFDATMKQASDYTIIGDILRQHQNETPEDVCCHLLNAGFQPTEVTNYLRMLSAVRDCFHSGVSPISTNKSNEGNNK